MCQTIKENGLIPEYLTSLDNESLEFFLNSCITKSGKDNFKLNFDFLKNRKFLSGLDEVSKNVELQCCITHPVISTFVDFKYKQLIPLHRISFFIFLLGFVGLAWSSLFAHSPYGFFIAGIILTIRELFQIVDKCNRGKFCEYWKELSNIYEILLIIFTFASAFSLLQLPFHDPYCKIFISITFLLTTIEICHLLTLMIPILSIYMHILKKVAITFLKTILVFSLFIVTFSLCFYLIFHEPIVSADGSIDNSQRTSINFNNIAINIVRTSIMITGEYDANELKYEDWWFSTVFIFIFVLASFVLINIINALTIADVQVGSTFH